MVHIRDLSGAGGQSWLEEAILVNCARRYIVQSCHTMRRYPLMAPGNIHNYLHYRRPWWKASVSIMLVGYSMQCMFYGEL
jgi:hypothetical protein